MFKKVHAKGFAAVPYLETSLLMQNHKKGVIFSLEKPNVIVGPNGAGKSALMRTLGLLTLSLSTGESAFDEKYVERLGGLKDMWNEAGWDAYDSETGSSWKFLTGLNYESDLAPALYYRPGAIPGEYEDVTHALMCGYSKEAQAYAKLTDHKSSGQQSQALLQKLLDALDGEFPNRAYKFVNWGYGQTRYSKEKLLSQGYTGPWEYQAEILKARYLSMAEDAIPCVLADEPEQSLDAKAEAKLWKKIAAVDTSKVQLIVATHSLYPFMHPELFNIIEAVPGYLKEVQAEL
jgi:ABC-type cobalamin/Fe3+-siderophores transport system ATPase subunit